MPFRVLARAARLRVVGFFECAAAGSLPAGIFWPSGTPRSRCRAPGCLMAPLIQFLATGSLLAAEFNLEVVGLWRQAREVGGDAKLERGERRHIVVRDRILARLLRVKDS